MTLSIILPTYKRPNDLKRTLSSIKELISSPQEVIVVIGPNDNESPEIAKEYQSTVANLKILHSEKASLIYSINKGLKVSSSEIICLIDDDVWLPCDWSEKIKKAYLNDPKLGAYGGRDHLQLGDPKYDKPLLADIVGKFLWNGSIKGNHHCGSVKSPVSVDILKGVNLSFRRSAFTPMQIDTALEGFGAEVCSEIDICQCIYKHGFTVIYDNNNYVLHYASPRLADDKRTDLFSPAWPARVFNQAFVIAKYRPLHELFIFTSRSIIFGSRAQPGFIFSVILTPKYGYKVLGLPWIYASSTLKGLSKGLFFRKVGKCSSALS